MKNCLLFLIIALAAGCITKGGKKLGNGSTGTIIVPQTPQQINEQNRPTFEPLPPPPLVQPPVEPINPVKSRPIPPKASPIKANPVIVNPKPAGEIEPFAPTVKVNVNPLPPPKLIEGDGGCVVTTNDKDKPEIAGPCEPAPEEKDMKINWTELIMFYATLAMLITIGWMVFKMIKTNPKGTKKAKKIKPSGSRRKVQRRNNKKA